ncbi:Protein kinase C-binding protein 1 [Halotydeus destructor]|nr:Protein kinase C-binding protein 1 [Halotydeus destructor]
MEINAVVSSSESVLGSSQGSSQPSSTVEKSETTWSAFADLQPDKSTWLNGDALQDLSNGTPGTVSAAFKRPLDITQDEEQTPKKKKAKLLDKESLLARGKDFTCHCCHKDKINVTCQDCPRAYHMKCLITNGILQNKDVKLADIEGTYDCYNCIIKKSPKDTMSEPLKALDEKRLNSLFILAIKHLRWTADPSFHLFNPDSHTDYKQTIVRPIDFTDIENSASRDEYKCVDQFLADLHWIVHNCYVYNNSSHPLTANAKQFWKQATGLMVDMEVCPDCFANQIEKPETWFTEVCNRPHILVWAKVTGHPFWPGKLVRLSASKKDADIRFFGGHERAWVPVESCFPLTEGNLNPKSKSQKKMDAALQELKDHIKKVETKIGRQYPFAKPRTKLNTRRITIPLTLEEIQDDENEPEEEVVEEPQADAENQLVIDVNGDSLKTNIVKSSASKTDEVKGQNARPRKLAKPSVSTVSSHQDQDKSGRQASKGDQLGKTLAAEEQDQMKAKYEKALEDYRKFKEEKEAQIEMLEKEYKVKLEKIKVEAVQLEKKKAEDEKRLLEKKHMKEIIEIKKQQWCAVCSQTAAYYCCWNTSYCGYQCQNSHWTVHMRNCQNQRGSQNNANGFQEAEDNNGPGSE